MRRILAFVAPFFALLLVTAVAHAAPISFLYAECTLRGGYSAAYGSCSLATDNDVKRRWDHIETYYGVNIVSSRPVAWRREDDQYVKADWEFTTSTGEHFTFYFMSAWRGCAPTFKEWADYHDDDGPANLC